MSDLVFIKYNRSLLRRYDSRDQIDPISLEEIDDSNEWLVGEIEEDGNNFVHGEDDGLTWNVASDAAGVNEDAYAFRSRPSRAQQVYTRKASSSKASASKTTKKASTSSSSRSTINLIDEEDGYEGEEDDIIGEAREDEDEDEDEDEGEENDDAVELADLDLDD